MSKSHLSDQLNKEWKSLVNLVEEFQESSKNDDKYVYEILFLLN